STDRKVPISTYSDATCTAASPVIGCASVSRFESATSSPASAHIGHTTANSNSAIRMSVKLMRKPNASRRLWHAAGKDGIGFSAERLVMPQVKQAAEQYKIETQEVVEHA